MGDEEARADDAAEAHARRREERHAAREEGHAVRKAHHKARGLGRYVPPPETAWTRGGEERGRGGQGTTREAIEVRVKGPRSRV